MAFGFLKPVSSLNGLPCSGHGLCLPSTIHSVQACGTPAIPYPILIKNFTCWWPPLPMVPTFPVTPERATVLVNRVPVSVMGDTFSLHPSTCTNIVVHICPCGKSMCAIPSPVPCSALTIEDGGVGHVRVVVATSLTVFAFKRPIARMLDPLGVGFPGFSLPCSSTVAFGHPTVLSS